MKFLLALLSVLEAVGATVTSIIVDIVNAESPKTLHIMCATCFNDIAIQKIQIPKTIMQNNIPKVTAADMVVIVTNTNQEAQKIMKTISIDNQAQFLLLWFQGHDFEQVFATCWSRNLVRIVAAIVSTKPVIFYTFIPFKQSACVDMTPVRVGKWPRFTTGLFPPGHIRDVHGCLINATAHHFPPYTVLRDSTPNATEEITGEWAPIVNALTAKFNAKLHLIPADVTIEWPDNHNLTDAFLLADFASMPSRALHMDLTTIARTECYSFCVPRSHHKRGPWKKLLRPLNYSVWMIFLFMFVVTSLTTYALLHGKESMVRVILNMIAVFAGEASSSPKSTGFVNKMVSITWSFTCLIITTLYQGKENSFRSSLHRLDSIETIDDIISVELPIRCDSILVDEMRNLYPKLSVKPFPSEYGVFGEPLGTVATTVYITNFRECSILNKRLGFRMDGRHPRAHIDGCIFMMPERLFLLPRHSPFTKRVSEVNVRLTEAGILQHLLDKDPLPEAVKIPLHALKRADIEPSLTLLGSGVLVAAIVCVAEVMLEKYFVHRCVNGRTFLQTLKRF